MNSTVNAIMVLAGILCLVLFLAVPIALPIGFVVARRRGRRIFAVILGILSVTAFFYAPRVWGGSGKRTQGVRKLGTLK